jgi:uncharacterized protein YdeI (YjbR/CyaY-like superfamily)
MKITNMLYVTNRKDWRTWLGKNHDIEKEVWLIYYKKHTETARIPYDDAVEEAICFGWIDSTVKKIDEDRYAQKFTPRKGRSKWSQKNIKRAEKMIQEGKMDESGLKIFRERIEYDETLEIRPLEMPPELEKALKMNNVAWKNFNSFAPSYQKQYILWVMSAKREETRQRRIQQTVALSEKNKKTGMM